MQREAEGGIIISCDFCGTDWDPYDETNARPMTEGHRGSVICLACVRRALDEAAVETDAGDVACTMCLKEQDASSMPHWRPARPDPEPPGGNPVAAICDDCIEQAARVFHKDADVDFHWSQDDMRARQAARKA